MFKCSSGGVLIGLGVLIAVNLVAVLGNLRGVTINTTASAPRGLWIKRGGGAFKRGDYVLICPDSDNFLLGKTRGYILKPGSCRNGYRPLLKQVVALRGDKVSVKRNGISVNGKLVPKTAPRVRDSSGRPLLSFKDEVVLVENEVFLSTKVKNGFDSRYFGVVTLSQIREKVVPLIVERGVRE